MFQYNFHLPVLAIFSCLSGAYYILTHQSSPFPRPPSPGVTYLNPFTRCILSLTSPLDFQTLKISIL
jgi:hypothetical protein